MTCAGGRAPGTIAADRVGHVAGLGATRAHRSAARACVVACGGALAARARGPLTSASTVTRRLAQT